jgi:putative transcriptional regulator
VLTLPNTLGLRRPDHVRIFQGDAGWEPGQLEEEIKENTWLVADSSQEEMMTSDENELWVESVRQMGGKYSMWENFPENPSLN